MLRTERIFCFLISVWSGFLTAQECPFHLQGRVIDLHDGTPIFGAILRIENTGQFAQTDEDGVYLLKNVCLEELRLIISHSECQTLERRIQLSENQSIDFELEHHINTLEEIVVSEKQKANVNQSVAEARLTATQIDQYSSQSLATALGSLTGVTTLKTGNAIAKPVIHGLYGSRVGIVAEGIRLQDQEWGADHAPTIDLNAFESVQVVKGASALKYGGDTAGGVIILNSFTPLPRDSLYGKTRLTGSSNGRGGAVSSQWIVTRATGFYFSGQLTAKRFGDLSTPEYILTNTGLKEGNINFKIGRSKVIKGWELSYSRFQNETGILRAAHIGNIQDLLRALQSEVPLVQDPFSYRIDAPKQQGVHHSIQAKVYNQFSEHSKWKIDYNYQRNQRKEFDIRRGDRADLPALDLQLQTHSILGSIQKKVDFDWDFEWGINGYLQDNYSNPDTGVKRLIPDYLKYQWGSFLTGKYQPNNLGSFEWGLRLDQVNWDVQKYYTRKDWTDRGYDQLFPSFEKEYLPTQLLTQPQFQFITLSAHAGFSLQLGPALKSTGAYILSQRSPNAAELFSDGLHHSLATIEYGNLTLDKETSHKVLVSVSTEKNPFSFSLEPYLARIHNYIYIAPKEVQQTIRGAFPVWQYNATEALLWGFDFQGSLDLSPRVQFNSKTSYVRINDISQSQPVISIPPFQTNQKLSYIFPKKEVRIEIENQFVASQRYFPDFNVVVNTLEGDKIVGQLVDFSTPPKAYSLYNLNISLPLKVTPKLSGQLRLMIHNITQTAYRDYLNRMRFYADEMGRNCSIQLILNH